MSKQEDDLIEDLMASSGVEYQRYRDDMEAIIDEQLLTAKSFWEEQKAYFVWHELMTKWLTEHPPK